MCDDVPCCLPKCSQCPPSPPSQWVPPPVRRNRPEPAPSRRSTASGSAGLFGSTAGGSYAHVARSPYGPWSPVALVGGFGCNNPAPFQHANGTIFIVCESSTLLRAEAIEGPYVQVSTINRSLAPVPVIEDAALWVDSEADGGGFHVLFHGFYRSGAHFSAFCPQIPLELCGFT